MQGEELASELNDQEVNDNDNHPDAQESWISPEVFADVELIVDFSGGYHVYNLQPDKQVEDESQVARILTVSILLLDRMIKGLSIDSIKSTRENFVVGLPIGVAKSTSLDVETKSLVGLRNHIFTAKQENEKNCHLEERHVYNVLSHLAGNNEVVFLHRHAEKNFGLRKLGCKSQSSKRVHNHVYP